MKKKKLRYSKSIIQKIQEFFYGERCCFLCKDSLPKSKELICSTCISLLQPLNKFEQFLFKREHLAGYINNCFILYQFDEQSKKMIHLLKYKSLAPIAKLFASLLYKVFQAPILKENYDVIIPCPLHPTKKRERGYNQAGLISKELSILSDIPLDVLSLKRIRYTKTQTTLSKVQRDKNLFDCFQYTSEEHGRKILLVDDVLSTGATIRNIVNSIKTVDKSSVCDIIAFASPVLT